MRRTTMQVMTLLMAGAGMLGAQGGGRAGGPPAGGARAVAPARRDTTRGPVRRDSLRTPEQRRALMESRMRDGLKQRLGLNDAQVTKFEATNKKFAEKHRLLRDQERDIRMALRDEQLRPDAARDGKLTELLDKQIATRRQAVDLMEQREKELAGFLTPQQRVKLSAARGAMWGGRGGPGGGRMMRMRGRPGMPAMRGRGGFVPGMPEQGGPMMGRGRMGQGGMMGQGMGPNQMGPNGRGPNGPPQGPNMQRRPMRPPQGEPQGQPQVPPTF